MNHKTRIWVAIGGGVVLLVAVYFLGVTRGYYGRVSLNNYGKIFDQELRHGTLGSTDLNLFWDVTGLIKDKYIGEVNYLDMLYGSIKGAVAALGDPYSVFTDPTENQEFFNALDGMYEGIGVELDLIDGHLVIVAALEDSPAARAGLRSRDEIMAVNGESVGGMTVPQVVEKIKGPVGTKVKLTIGRASEQNLIEVEMTRGVVRRASVSVEIDADKIATININRFASDTEPGFKGAVSEVLAKGAKGVILDLRNNPGGFLESGIKVANEFLPTGQILEERFKDGQKTPFYADGNGRLTKIPLVVLVNEGSASAAEIVAGALQDNQRAKLIGEVTFGKGSVQEVEPFTDGSALRLTIAKWYTPSGKSISDGGIRPDRVVQNDPAVDKDLQMQAARDSLIKEITK
ncbi:MAG: S41 family peptidase [bacterium]